MVVLSKVICRRLAEGEVGLDDVVQALAFARAFPIHLSWRNTIGMSLPIDMGLSYSSLEYCLKKDGNIALISKHLVTVSAPICLHRTAPLEKPVVSASAQPHMRNPLYQPIHIRRGILCSNGYDALPSPAELIRIILAGLGTSETYKDISVRGCSTSRPDVKSY